MGRVMVDTIALAVLVDEANRVVIREPDSPRLSNLKQAVEMATEALEDYARMLERLLELPPPPPWNPDSPDYEAWCKARDAGFISTEQTPLNFPKPG